MKSFCMSVEKSLWGNGNGEVCIYQNDYQDHSIGGWEEVALMVAKIDPF